MLGAWVWGKERASEHLWLIAHKGEDVREVADSFNLEVSIGIELYEVLLAHVWWQVRDSEVPWWRDLKFELLTISADDRGLIHLTTAMETTVNIS